MVIFLGVTELLMSPGKWPNSSGTRNLHDNLSDLRAQVAANQKVCLLDDTCVKLVIHLRWFLYSNIGTNYSKATVTSSVPCGRG